MAGKPRRHHRIAELLRRERIASQDALRERLGRDGIAVTQATLSRDLHELGVVKGPAGYVLPQGAVPPGQGAAAGSLGAALGASVSRVDHAGTLVVLHTGPGRAPLVALEIDRAPPSGVVGTVAGDDTVFIAVRSGGDAARLARDLRKAAGLAPASPHPTRNGAAR